MGTDSPISSPLSFSTSLAGGYWVTTLIGSIGPLGSGIYLGQASRGLCAQRRSTFEKLSWSCEIVIETMSRSQSQSRPSLRQTVIETIAGPPEPPPVPSSSEDSSQVNWSRDESSSSSFSEPDETPQPEYCRVCSQTLGDVNVLTCHGCTKKVHKGCRTAFRLADIHELSMCTTCGNNVLAKMQEIRQ